jgi:hypothetical protein
MAPDPRCKPAAVNPRVPPVQPTRQLEELGEVDATQGDQSELDTTYLGSELNPLARTTFRLERPRATVQGWGHSSASTPVTSTEQPQRDSNPCRHLESEKATRGALRVVAGQRALGSEFHGRRAQSRHKCIDIQNPSAWCGSILSCSTESLEAHFLVRAGHTMAGSGRRWEAQAPNCDPNDGSGQLHVVMTTLPRRRSRLT